MIHATLSKTILGDVWRLFLAKGAPKKAVREPCLSFFGAEGDPTAAEIEEAAFRLTFMLFQMVVAGGAMTRGVSSPRERGLIDAQSYAEPLVEMRSNFTCINSKVNEDHTNTAS